MFRFVALFLSVSGALIAGEGTQTHGHGPADLGNLGKVRFAVSCKPSVRAEFSRGVAMIHSFWYAEAEAAFRRVAAKDPECAMAYWGIAMSNYHPVWAAPTADELSEGREAAAKAVELAKSDERERAFITAINAFYAESDTLDHRTRALAYEKAMEKVASRFSSDDEASIFYALSLLGTASANDKSYANQKKAAEILNRIIPKQPEHPGVAHYVIHSNDYPALAPIALTAARAYAKIAPGSPHALHMPSHIFTRLGLWDESIESNLASAEKARRYVQQISKDRTSFDELHAVDYLVYAYLQQGNDAKAQAYLEKIGKTDGASIEAMQAAAYALGAVPARYALERGEWGEAARLEVRPSNFPWKKFLYAEANIHFARAVGAARTGDLNTAKASVDRLGELRKGLIEEKNVFWAEHVEIQRLGAEAWLARAAGLAAEGFRLMQAAVRLEDATEKHPVTPGALLPAREMLAEMYLEDGQPAEALRELELSLKSSPNRYNGLRLAARAAVAANDRAAAEAKYKALVELASGSPREEVRVARSYLTQR